MTVNGNLQPTTNLQGAQTQLSQPADIIVTSDELLIAANFNINSLTSYANATQTNGNIEPTGIVQGAATLLDAPASLVVNTAASLVLVANVNGDNITVYSTAGTFNGNLAPIRTFFTAGVLDNPTGINFGANDDLYVASPVSNNVLVYANASNLNGAVMPTRIITSAAFTNVFDVFVDGDDNLFAVNPGGTVLVFNNAAGLNGNQTPDSTLTVNGANLLSAIVVDVNDVGYIVDNGVNAVFCYNNVSQRNGAFNPDRTIQGAQTQLIDPIRAFLLER